MSALTSSWTHLILHSHKKGKPGHFIPLPLRSQLCVLRTLNGKKQRCLRHNSSISWNLAWFLQPVSKILVRRFSIGCGKIYNFPEDMGKIICGAQTWPQIDSGISIVNLPLFFIHSPVYSHQSWALHNHHCCLDFVMVFWHIIQITYLKYRIQWLLAYSELCSLILEYCHPKKKPNTY